eukprot:UN22604
MKLNEKYLRLQSSDINEFHLKALFISQNNFREAFKATHLEIESFFSMHTNA